MIGLDEQIACIRRELTARRRVYGRMVAGERMTAERATREIATMEAVLATLETLEAKERLF